MREAEKSPGINIMVDSDSETFSSYGEGTGSRTNSTHVGEGAHTLSAMSPLSPWAGMLSPMGIDGDNPEFVTYNKKNHKGLSIQHLGPADWDPDIRPGLRTESVGVGMGGIISASLGDVTLCPLV